MTVADTQVVELVEKVVGAPVVLTNTQAEGPVDFIAVAANHRLLIEAKQTASPASLEKGWRAATRAARGKDIALLLVPHMTRPAQDFCEAHGINWLDLAGNARIRSPRLVVHIEGRSKVSAAGRPASVFERRSSRIARLLLEHPAQRWTVSACASATGLDPGHVSRILARLVEDSLVRREGREHHVVSPQSLLDAWREGSMSRHTVTRGHVAARSGEELAHLLSTRLGELKLEHAATGLAAAWLYDRHAMFRLNSFYVRAPLSAQHLQHLGFTEEPVGANVWLMLPGDDGVFVGAREVDGVACVHPVQVYVDLKGQPERSDDATAHLRQNPTLLFGAPHAS